MGQSTTILPENTIRSTLPLYRVYPKAGWHNLRNFLAANSTQNYFLIASMLRFGLGDILSQRQIVPPAFFGRQIVPDDKMSHFLPMRQIVPATKCPISSPATKCPTDDPTEKPLFHWHFSGNKLSQGDKMSHFLPGDKMSQLMHLCT